MNTRDLIINNKDFANADGNMKVSIFGIQTIDFPEDAVQVLRYLNQETGSHLYSTSIYEQTILDQDTNWVNEGIAWYGGAAI